MDQTNETTQHEQIEERVREARSGVPTAIRRAGEHLNEAWQAVNGARAAIHDAFEAFADDWSSSRDTPLPDGARALFEALSSLQIAEHELLALAEAEQAEEQTEVPS